MNRFKKKNSVNITEKEFADVENQSPDDLEIENRDNAIENVVKIQKK